ncbi:MBL fold metallo-hydrolase [Pendulispora albinea]|uniref:MBL fold metallo-hydrolase n=1 Tax=Pendulispora albinea TaxID=2741071 RepID=A0ABZ2LSC3_9BACT
MYARSCALAAAAVLAVFVTGCSKDRASPAPAVSSSPPVASSGQASGRRTDTFATSKGELGVTPIRHGSLLFEYGGKTIYVDPSIDEDAVVDARLRTLPKADYLFMTDIHPDHLDPHAISLVKKDGTVLVGPPAVGEKTSLSVTLKNGESKDFGAFSAAAVPMYNRTRGPGPGQLFHDKGRGNGYIFTFGDKRVYVSGDTECTPEMRALANIDVAFVCMNLPYTMPPAEAAECVKAFKPKVVFPYHYRDSNLSEFEEPVRAAGASEVRIRSWY